MKKVITALFITTIFINTALIAGIVNITNSVETEPLTLSIVYDNDSNKVLNESNSNLDLIYTSSYLNEVDAKTTENFYIKASGNIPTSQNVNLNILCDQFVRYVDNVATTESGIYPSVLYTSDDDSNTTALANDSSNDHSYTIDDIVAPTNVILNNTKLGSFKLTWGGNESLVAGDYVSTVTFNISAA